MWPHNYVPVAGSLPLSALIASLPIFVLLFMLGVVRKAAWVSSLGGLAGAIIVALFVYRMPVSLMASSIFYGAVQGWFPIGWVVFTAILLYNITVHTGKFEIIKDSIGNLTSDRRLQALLIAFAFGAFIEGAAGFGTPVAVSAAMLTGLGFSPFYAAGICLLANTAPVAFGSIATPINMLTTVTGLPIMRLSAGVGRICAPVSVIIPAYLIMVMGGWGALRTIIPAAALCGVLFAGTQFVVSNFVGPELTDILGSLAAIVGLVILLKVWHPKDRFALPGDQPAPPAKHIPTGALLHAWSPYALLVLFVLLWSYKPIQAQLASTQIRIPWPGLHNLIQQVSPVVATPTPYGAVYAFNYLGASGTSCLIVAVLSALILGMKPGDFFKVLMSTIKQLALAELTIGTVLGLAFLMNYSGTTATLGLAFAATGATFPFFSALLGWLGVFLTGSDTSANALFGNLQVVTARSLGMNATLMASANSAGGVMGKMISLQSVAVASAATAMHSGKDESRLFRFTLRHSIFLACVTGLITVFYAYVAPGLAP